MNREWLVTNGIGGYASGMVAGDNTRSYHALLVAALHAPLGRVVIWSHLYERLSLSDGELMPVRWSEFRLENGLPVWRIVARDIQIERRIFLPYLQNTVVIIYQLVSGPQSVELELEPAFDFRKHGASVEPKSAYRYSADAVDGRLEIAAIGADLPPCRLTTSSGEVRFIQRAWTIEGVTYPEEAERGYPHVSELWSPGVFRIQLHDGQPAALIGSTEPWEKISNISPSLALADEHRRRRDLLARAGSAAADETGAQLVLAADQFVIRPVGRAEEGAQSPVDEIRSRTIIAGYHWFTDWGRDTMISLEGLTMTTRRFDEARQILLTFASYVRDGLIPNLFPDGQTTASITPPMRRSGSSMRSVVT